MAGIITEAGLFLVVLYLAHGLINWLVQKRKKHSVFRSAAIPGPSPNFWTGNSREYMSSYHVTLDRWVKKYGSRFGYYFGDMPYLVLSDVDEVQELLVKKGKAVPNRQTAVVNVEPFCSSLIDARGDRWRHSRKLLTPPFTAHKLTRGSARTVINSCISRFLVELEQKRLSGQPIDLSYYMKSVTLDIISRTAFSMDDTDVYEGQKSHMHRITAAIMEDTNNFVITGALYLPFMKKLVYLAYEAFGKYTLSIVNHLKRCIKNYYEKQKRTSGTEIKVEKKENILDFMLEQKALGNLNENEVLGNALTILVAGYDTTATGLVFTFYLLAKYQDIQEKLRAEILAAQVKPENNAEEENHCAFDDNRCEMLDRVWFESLRLYPPVVTFVTRELDDNLEEDSIVLSKSGVKVTKEMTVQVPVWTIHHDEEHWPEPNRFNPHRDGLPIPGAPVKDVSNAFLAFGIGPRNCIGSLLAVTEARAVLSAILLRYKVEFAEEETADQYDPKTGLLKLIVYSAIIIHPEKNIFLKLTPIDEIK